MQQQRFNIFIFLAAIGFLGILMTQAYWVYNGLLMRRDQFDRGIQLAMRTVLSRMIDYQSAQKLKCIELGEGCEELGQRIETAVPPALLDSLMRQEMTQLGLKGQYRYVVFNRPNKRFVAGLFEGFEDQLINSSYQQSLKAVFVQGDYVLSVVFPDIQHHAIGRFSLWVVLSSVFLISLLFSFWSTVSLVRRQKRLTRIKADFINNMTHELKTPIASISLAAEMLSKQVVASDYAKVARYASVVKSESSRLQTLVDHVLMSAMLEEGKVRLNRHKANISQLVEEVVHNFTHRVSELSGKLELNIEAGLPMIYFDRLHMTNVLVNLLDNAIKYSRGAPEIWVSVKSTSGHVVLAVADSGVGISLEEKDLIFKNLYRSHTGNLHDVKGFGIGLFYVKKIVELHGGKITVESEHGAGSVFEVYLPAVINTENYES